jgi:hypothetical protein
MVKEINMSLNNFKATVRKWANIPWTEFRDLFTWPSRSNLQADNPNLLIATAKDATGKTVCFATAESIFLIDGYVFSPETAPSELEQAGDSIISAFEREAQKAGVGRIFTVVPNNVPSKPGDKWIRISERKVPQAITTQQRVSCALRSPAGFFVN